MTTTQTSSQVSATAFADELVKIAAAQKKQGKLGPWLRDAGIISAGAGLGTGAYMLTEKALAPKLGPKWNSLNPGTRRAVAGAGAAAATLGGMALAHRLAKEKQKK
jgi:hypothetical protein